MRFKQLQRSETVRTHYRLYKSGKRWCTALVMLMGSSALGATLLVKPVTANAAETTPTTVTATSGASSAATSSPSMALSAPSTATSSVSAATAPLTSATTSAAPTLSATSNAPASVASAVTSPESVASPISVASNAPASVASASSDSNVASDGTSVASMPVSTATSAEVSPATSVGSAPTSVASVAASSDSVATSGSPTAPSAGSAPTSVASVAASTVSVATSATSVAASTDSVATSVASVAASTDSVATSVASVAASAGSVATSATSVATSAASVAASAGSVATSATSVATSTDSVATSATSVAASTGSAATSAASSTPTVPDSTVVTFGDTGIESAIQSDLGITGTITVGDIRNFKQATLNVGTPFKLLNVTGTLDGMQYLQYLPSTTLISMWTNYTNPSIDLTPLIPLHFSQISVNISDMSAADLTPLLKIDPSQINEVDLISSIAGVQYQKNQLGLTNAQLVMLEPWLAAIDNTDVLRDGQPKYFNFSDGSLTDFSPLKGFTKPVTIAAAGQSVAVGKIVNFVTGQPGIFTAIPLTGVEGESLTSKFENTWNGTDISKTAATETPLVPLGNNQFEIPTAYAAINGANWFAYGFRGMPYSNGNPADYIDINYSNGVELKYDIMVYQAANWQTAPSVSASFTDESGRTIAPPISENGAKIGDTFDFSRQATIPGYTLLPGYSSATTGTYSQNPQYAELRYEADPVVAGGITINYVDPDGEPIVPPEQIKGDVGDSYTATPATIGNYVCKAVSPDSVATTGTLALAKSTITYQYDPVTVTRVINYVDAIANKNIGSTTLTVPYKGTIPDPTAAAIASYAAKGYQLVSNGYPADGSAFSSAALVRDYRVLFTHEIVTLNPGDTLPAGVVLTHNVTQTINFNYADGQTAAPSVTRRLMFTRRAVQDAVTGETQLTTWQPTGASSFAAYSVPVIENYQPDVAQVPSTVVTGESSNLLRTVTYTPKAGAVTVAYYLARTTKALKPSAELTGTVATPYDVMAPTIAGYHLVTDEAASATGDYSDPAATVDFYYEPDAATTGSTSQPGVTTVTATPVTHRLGWVVSSPSRGSLARTASATTPTPVRTQIQLAPPVHHRLSPVTHPIAKVTTGTLPQTSEQRPTNIWGILALTMIGFVGVIRLRRER